MAQFIETPRDKKKEAYMVKKNKTPRTIKVKTLIITGVLIASHVLAFVAGTQAKRSYDAIIDRAVAERIAEEVDPKDRAQQ